MAKGSKRAKQSAQRAGEAASAIRENPYVQRLIEDEELRETIREAFEAARSAYDRASKSKHPARSLVDDKKVQRDLREAADSLREVSDALRDPRPSSSSTFGRLLLIAFAGAVLAIVLSEDLRQAVLDKLFGAEEEFEYASTTAPAGATSNNAGAPSGAAAAAESAG